MSPRVVVVGGGISGLGTAWRLKLRRPDLEVTVVEASARFGGKLISEHRDGFVVEGAADGFLSRKPPALVWAQDLGLGPRMVEPRPEHRFSQVLWQGALHPFPQGFSGLVPVDPEGLRSSSLLSRAGADRAAGEAAVPANRGMAEESVEGFFTRRYGSEAFGRLMEPLLAGIYAGDASALSADAAFPQLTALERQGQSLTAGLSGAPPAEGPAFRSFAGGMAELPQALAAAVVGLGGLLVAGEPVIGIDRAGEGFVLRSVRQSWEADAVVLALGPRASGGLLRSVSPALATLLEAWPTSSVANLNLAFDEGEVPLLPSGSGFVAPKAGGTPYSAATWSSRKWPGRAPEGKVLVRVYFGGARDPQGWARSEADLVDAALGLVASFHPGRRPQALWHRLFRWRDAFAQPNLGHAGRHATLGATSVPGVLLAGGYFNGVGIPDCLARADEVSEAVDRFLTNGDIEP